MWRRVGVDGSVDGDELLVAVGNDAVNALDNFLDVQVLGETAPSGGGGTRVTLHVALTNRVPAQDLAAVARSGSAGDGRRSRGTYSGRVTLYLPGSATTLTATPPGAGVQAGRDGPLSISSSPIVVEPGGSATVTVEFEMPPGSSFRVLPSARPHEVSWTLGGQQWDDSRPHTVQLP
jgi:hypothetical protein